MQPEKKQGQSFNLCKKDNNGKLEIAMSVHVDYVFMLEKSETLEKTKYKINMEFNIQESGKVKKFLGVYYEWGHDAKGFYTK